MVTPNILFLSFLISSSLALLTILTRNIHGRLTYDTFDGVQKIHSIPTPRIGGLGITISSVILAFFLYPASLMSTIIICSAPIFIAGFIEDINKNVRPIIRLSLAFISGIIFVYITDYKIERIDLFPIDYLLSIYIVSLIFTTFCIGGVINSINIIDGFNGLASGSLIIMLITFSYISFCVGDLELMSLCLNFSAIIFGFFIFNFPYGKIFLGDGGAYFCGFVLVAIAIMLPTRNPDLSPWLSLLICAYPILETIVSIVRKTKRKGHNAGMPDKLHLHMLVHRDLARKVSKSLKVYHLRNSTTSVIMWVLPLSHSLFAILFYDKIVIILVSITISYFTYVYIYKKCTFK